MSGSDRVIFMPVEPQEDEPEDGDREPWAVFPWSAHPVCAKCTSSEEHVWLYCEGDVRRHKVGCPGREHMAIRCSRCSYLWFQEVAPPPPEAI